MSEPGAAVPTGCFKCGRPGHWSRDCPSSSSSSNPNNTNPKSSGFPPFSSTSTYPKGGSDSGSGGFLGKPFADKPAVEKPKKVPKTRPKLTPDMLLSEDGLGYILRLFPRNFKYRGRGHEVSDLKNLLTMYAEWRSSLFPTYSFDQFIHKVEQVGANKRVRLCLRGLRERVADGGDLTKLNISTNQEVPVNEEVVADPKKPEEPGHHQSAPTMDIDDQHRDLFEEIFNQTVTEPSQTLQSNHVASNTDTTTRDNPTAQNTTDEVANGNNGAKSSDVVQISEEQRARMEASKRKALERAAARRRIQAASS